MAIQKPGSKQLFWDCLIILILNPKLCMKQSGNKGDNCTPLISQFTKRASFKCLTQNDFLQLIYGTKMKKRTEAIAEYVVWLMKKYQEIRQIHSDALYKVIEVQKCSTRGSFLMVMARAESSKDTDGQLA
jgi:hypothetical protein